MLQFCEMYYLPQGSSAGRLDSEEMVNEDPYVSGVCLLEEITTKCCMPLIGDQHQWPRCVSVKKLILIEHLRRY